MASYHHIIHHTIVKSYWSNNCRTACWMAGCCLRSSKLVADVPSQYRQYTSGVVSLGLRFAWQHDTLQHARLLFELAFKCFEVVHVRLQLKNSQCVGKPCLVFQGSKLYFVAPICLSWANVSSGKNPCSNPRCLPSCLPRCFRDHSFSFRRWRVSWYLFRRASTKTSCVKFKVEWTSLGRCGECSSRHFRDWMVSLYSSASSSARFRGRRFRFCRPPQLSFVLNFPSWRFLMLLMMWHVPKSENIWKWYEETS